MFSLCYASGDFVCPGTATEARLGGSEELNESLVAQWLRHLPLILEDTGSIRARVRKILVSKHALSSFSCRDDPR